MTPALSAHEVRKNLRARLADGRLFPTVGVSTVRHGTGRPCNVCGRSIDPAMERQVQNSGTFALAHEGACYQSDVA